MLHGGAGVTSSLMDAVSVTQHGAIRYQKDLSGLSCQRLGWVLGGTAPREVEFQPSASQMSAPCARLCGGCGVRVEFMTLHQTCFHFELGILEEKQLRSGTSVLSIHCFILPDLRGSESLDSKTGMRSGVVKKMTFFSWLWFRMFLS